MTTFKNNLKPKISIVTLGCSKNLVDSEVLLGQLTGGKANIVDDVDDADIAVINTCGFIEAAKQESIDAILEAVERKNQGKLKKVVVMGCLSERFAKDLAAEIPSVDAYFGSHHIAQIVRELGVEYREELLGERQLTTPSHYAYLKISEGCDNPCSFCAIPLMRGLHVSRPLGQLVTEAHHLASRGVKELILIGQDTTYYGLDLQKDRQLDALLSELAGVEGIEWIRLMYAYPAKFPKSILSVIRDNPNICRYLDMPIQHVADEVLKSMRRGVTNRSLRDLLSEIKTAVPGIGLRTTLIVGYPNETDDDFEQLCEFVNEVRFHRLGVFTYSQEEGTTAFDLGDPIPTELKEERRARIMELQQRISEEHNESIVGSDVRVLIDRVEDEFFVGRTEWDAPEIDQEVYVKSSAALPIGSFVDAHVTRCTEYDLYAEVSGTTIDRRI
ncbi:MAG: 30S ribosomal protein S12 methylthiotransferase RimO [Ignavibacteriales bacterium]|nr:30S ribosomal protein S12 methylthiotransferase RimO [Ignavibacteriales bacterium]